MHIVEDCPVTRCPNGLPALHLADENALIWLDTQSKDKERKEVQQKNRKHTVPHNPNCMSNIKISL